MLQTKIVFAIALATFGSTSAHAASCPTPSGEAWVPNEAVAKQIYLAVGPTQHIPGFGNFPEITAKDSGDHWSVWQGGASPLTLGSPLRIDIDKCTGAISNAFMEVQ